MGITQSLLGRAPPEKRADDLLKHVEPQIRGTLHFARGMRAGLPRRSPFTVPLRAGDGLTLAMAIWRMSVDGHVSREDFGGTPPEFKDGDLILRLTVEPDADLALANVLIGRLQNILMDGAAPDVLLRHPAHLMVELVDDTDMAEMESRVVGRWPLRREENVGVSFGYVYAGTRPFRLLHWSNFGAAARAPMAAVKSDMRTRLTGYCLTAMTLAWPSHDHVQCTTLTSLAVEDATERLVLLPRDGRDPDILPDARLFLDAFVVFWNSRRNE